jgi:hypothetical protein
MSEKVRFTILLGLLLASIVLLWLANNAANNVLFQ